MATGNKYELDLSHSMVHYLLTIHKLREEKGYARVTDVAKDLDLTKGSVSTALGNLRKRGLVDEEKDSKFIILTDKGHDEVHAILSARTLLFYFLKDFLGVHEEVAQKDSCLMEHLISEETRKKFFSFMKSMACCTDDECMKKLSEIKQATSLDFCSMDSMDEFEGMQKGDSHL